MYAVKLYPAALNVPAVKVNCPVKVGIPPLRFEGDGPANTKLSPKVTVIPVPLTVKFPLMVAVFDVIVEEPRKVVVPVLFQVVVELNVKLPYKLSALVFAAIEPENPVKFNAPMREVVPMVKAKVPDVILKLNTLLAVPPVTWAFIVEAVALLRDMLTVGVPVYVKFVALFVVQDVPVPVTVMLPVPN
jgi:hypothetical protein